MGSEIHKQFLTWLPGKLKGTGFEENLVTPYVLIPLNFLLTKIKLEIEFLLLNFAVKKRYISFVSLMQEAQKPLAECFTSVLKGGGFQDVILAWFDQYSVLYYITTAGL